VLSAWWWALHALLVAAAWLAGVAVPLKALAALAVVVHAVRCRPSAPPRRVVVTADGFCIVPEWEADPRALGARTLVCPWWIRLDIGQGGRRRDLLLVADQVRPQEWRRLRALLMRMRCE